MPLKVSDGIGSWIKDFKKSDAPQFKGKSDKERRDQAIAAYLSAKNGPQEAVDPKAAIKDRITTLQKKRQTARSAAAETDSPSDKRRHSMKAQIAQKQIQMAQQRMGQMEAYGASNPKFNAQDMVGHNNKKVFKQKREDSDAVKAFLAKGGKIKKLPPAKAQGYHGKDDPGKDMHGVMDRPDTKAIGTRKKVKSMEAKVNELSPATKKSYINKAASDIDNRSYAQGTVDATNTKYNGKNNRKIANRLKGIRRATKEAKQTHMFDNEKDARAKAKEIGGKYVKGVGKSVGKHAAIKEGYGGTSFSMKAMSKMKPQEKEKPPFDNAKPVNKDPKDKFGNPIKNRAKHLARQAARNLVNKQKNESSYAKLNKYNKDAQTSKDKATNSAVATILRKGDHSKDLNTMRKREKGLKMVKSRITDKIRKGHKKDEGYASHAQRKAVWASRNDAKKEGKVNELSPDTKKSYTKKATTDLYGRGLRKGMDIERGSSSLGRTKVVDKDNDRKISNRHAGIYRAQK